MLNLPIGSLVAASKAACVDPKSLPSPAFFVHLPWLARYSRLSAFSMRIFIGEDATGSLELQACSAHLTFCLAVHEGVAGISERNRKTASFFPELTPTVPLPEPPRHGGRKPPIPGVRFPRPTAGLPALWCCGLAMRRSGSVCRVGCLPPGPKPAALGQQHPFLSASGCRRTAVGQLRSESGEPTFERRLEG